MIAGSGALLDVSEPTSDLTGWHIAATNIDPVNPTFVTLILICT